MITDGFSDEFLAGMIRSEPVPGRHPGGLAVGAWRSGQRRPAGDHVRGDPRPPRHGRQLPRRPRPPPAVPVRSSPRDRTAAARSSRSGSGTASPSRTCRSSPPSADDPSARPVALGEFVLGHPNAYGLLTQRPVLPQHLDPPGPAAGAAGRRRTAAIPTAVRIWAATAPTSCCAPCAQDVDAFDAYVTTTAAELGLDPELLAAKMVGRWRGGASLVQSPDVDRADLATANDFGYHHDDVRGLRCPLGAHVRRANPRDSLDPRPGSDASQAVTDRHRLLRRGRVFADDRQTGSAVRRPERQSRSSVRVRPAQLAERPEVRRPDRRPGPAGHPTHPGAVFTIPEQPFRTRVCGLPEFVTTLGGAYFFLPGLRALRYLAAGELPGGGVVVKLDRIVNDRPGPRLLGRRAGSTRSSAR